MSHHNHFVLRNSLAKTLTLCIEPEGAFFSLGKGEQVSVMDSFAKSPVTIELNSSDKGEPIVSIWPGDGEVRVEKDGVDVLDLLQNGGGIQDIGMPLIGQARAV